MVARFISFHLISSFGNRDVTRGVPVFDFFAFGVMFGKPSLCVDCVVGKESALGWSERGECMS